MSNGVNSQKNKRIALQPVRANALVNSECGDAHASLPLDSVVVSPRGNFSSGIRRNQLTRLVVQKTAQPTQRYPGLPGA